LVVELPEPPGQLTLTLALAMAAPVAATPLRLTPALVELPPQPNKMAALNNAAASGRMTPIGAFVN
jgi:hypothetical protein